MSMAKENGIPKYVLLREMLLGQIASGELKPGDRFCTQEELMSKYGLSFATVTHALKDMTKAGYLVRKKRLGTFVADRSAVEAPDLRKLDGSTVFVSGSAFDCGMDDPANGNLAWFAFSEMQKGIANAHSGPVRFVPFDQLKALPKAKAILLNPSVQEMNALREASVDFAVIDHSRELDLAFDSVSWEMMFGSYELVAWLARKLGHEKIAFIGGDSPRYFADRYAAYAIGLSAHSLRLREDYVIRGLRGRESDGFEAAKRLLALDDPPTAIFADTDLKAFGAARAVKEAGLRVPDDISIAGFDDMPGADSFDPPLSSVKVPYCEMGAKAVEILMRKNAGELQVPSETVKSRFIARASCAKRKEMR